MWVAETLDYIKGSNKPNKVRNIYAIHTRFYTELLQLRVLVFHSPSIDLSVEVQMTSREPLCLCRFRCLIEGKARTKAERIERVIVVRSTKAIESTDRNNNINKIINKICNHI